MSVHPKGDPDATVSPMIQTPKAAIPAEINNESALSHMRPYSRSRSARKRPPTEVASSKCVVLADSCAFLIRSLSLFNSHN